MLNLFEAARRVSVPLVLVRTSDQIATAEMLKEASKAHPVLQWDAARGLMGANDKGLAECKRIKASPENTTGFVDAMIKVQDLAQGAVVFAFNAQRQLASAEPMGVAAAIQAVANLREPYKANFRMLVLFGPYGFVAPPELEQDVVVFDHALPNAEELGAIVKDLYQAAKQAAPAADVVGKAVEAVSGLNHFAAEQQGAMSFTEKGLDIGMLWERKRVTIEQTPGLSVWRGTEKFADIIGQDAVKLAARQRIDGTRPIGVVVWIDEIDKALANVEADTSGVRMYQLLKLLTEMENNEWPGFVAAGVAGAGKSLIAKAFGNEAGVPTVALDLGATESKYVGESEANLLRVLSIIKAVGRGHAYFIATSNAATVMRPELQRRFFDGMWMFDLMTDAERKAAWTFYMKKYGLKAQALPVDEAWTGAEIRNACRRAADVKVSLVDAARTIVPMAQSRADEIERLRQYAHGRFLDANKGGTYRYEKEPMKKQLRAIALPDVPVDPVTLMKDLVSIGKES